MKIERKTFKKRGQFQDKRNLRRGKSIMVDERDSGYYGYRCNKGVCRNV